MNVQRSDFDLLRGFFRNGDQAAFTQLARRHLNLVYATALRKLQDEGAAQDVAQDVFAALARKAWQFAPDDSLPAWLYKTTLLESRTWLRGELRRRRREQTAAELGTTMKIPADEPALRALVPLLDEALLSLREKDRTALLLRFYEQQPLREVGSSLGVAEDAARKRVSSALEKLAQFFHRRGYKTATVGAAAAALQHTASSAPTVVADSVLSAAARMAPASVPALAAPLVHLASLTKMQTAAVCVALALVPLGWQWRTQNHAWQEASAAQSRMSALQIERSDLQIQLEHSVDELSRLNAMLADEGSRAARHIEAANKFAAWKDRVRSLLAAADYHWPEDSPFVRIPKSVVKRLGGPNYSIKPPGKLSQASRELLGLTPQEGEQIETALQTHFSALDGLIEQRVYETNALSPFPSRFGIPVGALASQVWEIPPLGDEAATAAAQLQAVLEQTLGEERWGLVKDQLDSTGTDTLRRVLNLEATRYPQEIAVWISNFKGAMTVGYGWQGNGGAFTSDGESLESFRAGTAPAGRMSPAEFLGYRGLPPPVTSRMLDWIQGQAAAFAQTETTK